ncbi:MAG: hypothetical protein IKR49_01060 [Clostridia bacterium]|nr:hypothetical protein [Clostridia bacterium]
MAFNFNAYKEETFDIIVDVPEADGSKHEEELHIKTPSLDVYEDFTSRADRAETETNLAILRKLCCDILNENREGVKFTEKDVGELPGNAVSEFVTMYFNWLQETRAEKN